MAAAGAWATGGFLTVDELGRTGGARVALERSIFKFVEGIGMVCGNFDTGAGK